MVSKQTQANLTKFLLKLNESEKLQETLRQKICQNSYFQVESVFARFDKFHKGYLLPSDFAEYMLENKLVPQEEELYVVFKDFDKGKQGVVTVQRFEHQMVPRENARLRKECLSRNPYPWAPRLEVDLQFQIVKYFEAKIDSFHSLNVLRAAIFRDPNFRSVDALMLLDTEKTSTINQKEQVDEFLRKNGQCLRTEDLRRIYQCLALHRQGPVTVQRMEENLEPLRYGFYPLYKQRLAERVEMGETSKRNRQQRVRLQEDRVKSHQIEQLEMEEYLRLKNSNVGLSHVLESQTVERYGLARQAEENLRRSRTILAEERQLARRQLLLRESRLHREALTLGYSRFY